MGFPPRERRELLTGAALLAAPLFVESAAGEAPDGHGFSLLHGLYWLTANLAERRPMLLAVDDLQWADASSLRFLHYLVHRVEDLPLVVVLAMGPDDVGELRELARGSLRIRAPRLWRWRR
ncbi:MAG: AAA family ATPase [Solirubrobacteraceae bacterium]